jgi:hypothetical protein
MALGQSCGQPGPDLIVGDIGGVLNYANEGDIDAFSINVTQCNVGSAAITVNAGSPNHPMTTSNLFRLRTGDSGGGMRLEHIGMSWVFHTSTALTQNLCCTCNGQGGAVVGVGCSNVHSPGIMGTQSMLSPRWQINASGGMANYPLANPAFSGTVARRLQAHIDDVDPALNVGALYFVEDHVLTPDDAAADNGDNNVSYRRVTISGTRPNFAMSIAAGSSIQRIATAIDAWASAEAGVQISIIHAPDGIYRLGARATDLGGGNWHYEYALANVNSDMSVRAFSVPLSAGSGISNIGFHDVDYHSGDGVGDVTTSGIDWLGVVGGNSVTWATDAFARNPNANALRWATIYNFRFDSNRPPVAGIITLQTFKSPGSLTTQSIVPQPLCPMDVTGNGAVDIDDLLSVINNWGVSGVGIPADVNQSGAVDIEDLLAVINAWGSCA